MFYKWKEKSPIQSLTWATSLYLVDFLFFILFLKNFFGPINTQYIKDWKAQRGTFPQISRQRRQGFFCSAVLHALVISIYIYIKSGRACDEAAKWLLAPAAAERANPFTAARWGKLISWHVSAAAPSCHWMPPNLPPWASNLSPSTPNVDQSQVGGSLPEIKKDKTPLCVHVTISIKVVE